jgi:hypothetical protein
MPPKVKVVCYKCHRRELEGGWFDINDRMFTSRPGIMEAIERKDKTCSLKADYRFVDGMKQLFKCNTCLGSKKSQKKNKSYNEKLKRDRELLKDVKSVIEPLRGKIKEHDEKLRDHDQKIHTNNVVVNNLVQKVYCPTEEELKRQHQRLKP